MKSIVYLSLLLFLFLSACKQEAGYKAVKSAEDVNEEFEVKDMMDEGEEVEEIIYSMYLPTDIAALFEKSGNNFNPAIPAPINILPLYTDPEQIAVMLGLLGVDLSYIKIMQQKAPAAEYYSAIKVLADNLGLPEQIFEASTIKLEKYIGNQDSLALIIKKVYEDTDLFFKENGKDNLAALSLLGGWIEAMYIGVNIYNNEAGNISMAHKILQQKFTLNSIYSILSNHRESLRVTSYLLMLKKLRQHYRNVEILYPVEGFSVDTTQKKIQTSDAVIHYDSTTLYDINRTLVQMRDELISVD